ncbi:methyltransferase [Kribbella sp. CA-253562]|uniref:methyltransferase n=1 Tax=Kribbella sp. CA-253562 TaxID=3239942 RepID=UPI003D917068
MKLVARSVHGLEWVCAAEIAESLDTASGIRLARREISFELPDADRRVLGLRCAEDAFLVVGTVAGTGTTKAALPALATQLAELEWDAALASLRALRDLRGRFTFDCVVSIEGKRTYNRYDVEGVAGRAVARRLGGEFLPRDPQGGLSATPDLTVRLFLRGSETIAALRLASRPLHRRDYKLQTGPGTLQPPVAAALAALAGPLPGATILDPFCGDGTIAIEAALTWPTARVLAADLDPDRVANTRANAAAAGVSLGISQADAGAPVEGRPPLDAVLTNPPWNVAVQSQGSLGRSLDKFWRRLPAGLDPAAKICLVGDVELDLPAVLERRGYRLGLQTQLRLAGRLVHLVLARGPAGDVPELPENLWTWRRRAIREGVVTEAGF